MKVCNKIRTSLPKILSATFMCCCLFFLTGVNFIVFPQVEKKNAVASNMAGKSDDDPSAPVEEKSSGNNSVNIQEEYIHEKHNLDELVDIDKLVHVQVPHTEELQVVHYELLSPPPEC
ncbi:MAG: hypothetical protein U0T68_14060 [Ferruginibacter sp.]